MSTSKKKLLTGLQPSGTLHIGNYFGALKPFVEMYEEYDSHLMVVDYHALTSIKEPEVLRQNIINVVKDYIAAGVDPEKAVLFQQSDVKEHTELAWVLNCQVTVPFLMQAHSYKDKVAKGLEANAGLFTYPMLMAADILLYDTEVVPVGEDQRQHIEYTREAATKFNNSYGDTFTPPTELINKSTGVIPGIDGQKMSKSYKNTIPLFGSVEEIEKAVMSIVTDSEGDVPENVYKIHSLFRPEAELNDLYAEHKGRYGDIKKMLLTDIEEVVAPMREKREKIGEKDVINILQNGAERASQQAAKKMQEVREKIGISLNVR